jgi:hypothetical protein
MTEDTIEFLVRNRDTGRDIKVKRRGHVYRVGGVDIVLFPIGVLATAIARDVKTIRRWEKEDGWPAGQWSVPNKKHCKRWYSARQILAIHEVYWRISRQGDRGFSHSPHFPLAQFIQEVRAFFYKVDAQAVTKGS